MPYDNLCKYLAEHYPLHFAAWALGEPVTEAEVLKTELSVEPVRADSVLYLKQRGEILHLEFQTTPRSQPSLPLRMLDYWVRLHRTYRLPVQQFLVFLRETKEEIPVEFRAPNTWHRYQVIKLWEQAAEPLLNSPGLLPLAVFTRAEQPARLLEQIVSHGAPMTSEEERRNLLSCAAILAGLRFDKQTISSVFPEEIMQESVIYQDIIQRGIQQGIQQGEIKGELKTVLRLLTHRFGALTPEIEARISALQAESLDALSVALLDFKQLSDLEDWLSKNA